jgi:Electron transfer DM13
MKISRIQQAGILGLVGVIAAISYQPTLQAAPSLAALLSSLRSAQSAQPAQSTQPAQSVQSAQPTQPAQSTQSAQSTVSGAPFVSVSHPTSGSAKIVDVEGQRYLELDAAFRSDEGPDLFVLLHREAVPESYGEQDYVNLGRLQQVAGTQRYAIPADLDIQTIQSAVIWCQDFSVTFGYATL